MTNAAREAILARIRHALAAAPPRGQSGVPRNYARTRPQADLLEHFVERVEDYRAVVNRVTPAELPDAIATACARYGVRSIVVPADAPQEWTSELGGVEVARDGDAGSATVLGTAEIEEFDAVLTGVAVGVAETGTIVLDCGPRQGRRVLTLLPDVYVCVVHSGQVVDDVPQAVAGLDPQRPLTFISGPSATSDIELDRVEGVHGPRTLHVLLVEE
jgi:L-lactate dehydrogenase complex protein LldG